MTGNKQFSILFVSSLSSFFATFMGSSINVALPAIGQEFNMNAIMLNWAATSYLLAASALLIQMGRLADILGRKKLFIIGLFGYIISSALCTAAFSDWSFICFRILQGFSVSMIFGSGTALLLSVIEPHRRGQALGLTVAATYLGLASGPFLGGIIVKYLNWHSIFLVPLPFLLLSFFLLHKNIPEHRPHKGTQLNIKASLFLAFFIIFFIPAVGNILSLFGLFLLVVSLICLFLYLYIDLKSLYPLIPRELFLSNKIFSFSSIVALIHYSATFALSFLLSIFLQNIQHLDARQTGFILVWQPVTMALLSPLAGRLSDRTNPASLSSLGLFLTAAGLFTLSFLLTINLQTIHLVIMLGLIGAGIALFSSPNTNLSMSAVDQHSFGVASSVLSSMRTIGQMLSMAITLLVFSVYLGKNTISYQTRTEFLKSSQLLFVIFATLCLVAAVLTYTVLRKHFKQT